MKAIFALLAGLLSIIMSAQEKRTVETYNKIHVSGSFEVKIVSGEPGNIVLQGDKDATSRIITTVQDGTLIIKPEYNFVKQGKNVSSVKITVPATSLTELSLKGSGTVSSSTTIGTDISINLNGSGTISMRVDNNKCAAKISGSGDLKLRGRTQNFTCEVIGSGTANALDLDTSSAEAEIAGSGDILVAPKNAIKGRITGSGTIAFSGNPKNKDLKQSGSGKFKLID